MTVWVRVRDRETGHQYDVAEQAFDADAHVKVNAPARWPDTVEGPRPPLHNPHLGGAPGADEQDGTTDPTGTPAADTPSTKDGT